MPTSMHKPLPPWIVFNNPGTDGGGNTLTDEQFLEQHGFPRNTATDDMTPEQEAKYWRHESKKHQADAKAKSKELGRWAGLGDYDTVHQSLQTADQQRLSSLTSAEQAQKATEDAEKAARAAGYTEARDKFAKPALTAILVARTKGAEESDDDATERVSAVLDVLDVQKFIGDDGTLDAEKVEAVAASFAPKEAPGSATSSGRLAEALRSSTRTPAGSGGSVNTYRQQAKERRTHQ